MGRNRVVEPLVDRIPVSDGDWIELKKELNTGEQKRLEAAGQKAPVLLNGVPFQPIDWAVYELERAMIFLRGWSFQDFSADPESPQPLKLSYAALASLDVDTFREVNEAILSHVMKSAAAKKAKRAAAEEAARTAAQTAETQPAQSSNPPDTTDSAPTSTS